MKSTEECNDYKENELGIWAAIRTINQMRKKKQPTTNALAKQNKINHAWGKKMYKASSQAKWRKESESRLKTLLKRRKARTSQFRNLFSHIFFLFSINILGPPNKPKKKEIKKKKP